jgi:hypothetical protein
MTEQQRIPLTLKQTTGRLVKINLSPSAVSSLAKERIRTQIQRHYDVIDVSDSAVALCGTLRCRRNRSDGKKYDTGDRAFSSRIGYSTDASGWVTRR